MMIYDDLNDEKTVFRQKKRHVGSNLLNASFSTRQSFLITKNL